MLLLFRKDTLLVLLVSAGTQDTTATLSLSLSLSLSLGKDVKLLKLLRWHCGAWLGQQDKDRIWGSSAVRLLMPWRSSSGGGGGD